MQGTELSASKERQKKKKVRQRVVFIESHQMSETKLMLKGLSSEIYLAESIINS